MEAYVIKDGDEYRPIKRELGTKDIREARIYKTPEGAAKSTRYWSGKVVKITIEEEGEVEE